tara:strand:- start:656 stop:1051 length:396 start_codon:yes stop_codon:yes gene_type:complete
MNNKTSQILSIIVLSVLAIILIVQILKKNNKEDFAALKYQKYGYQNPNVPLGISQLDYATLLSRYDLRSKRLPGAGTLSWESDTVLRNKNLMPIMNLMYGRTCEVPKISKMGGYAIYKEQNEMLPVESRNS